MEARSRHEIPSIVFIFVLFFLFTQSIESSIDSEKTKLIKAQLNKINKPFVKSIKSSDGDIIDCVLFHLQPAFDLPELKGKMTMDLPEMPNGHENTETKSEIKQLWSLNGESCPNGTIPIRRTSESDMLRFSTMAKKINAKFIPAPGHEHAVGYATDVEFYGAKARLNLWRPNVVENDFSLSQIWVIANVPNRDVQSVEACWHVFPHMYKDNIPRLFTYWTHDDYRSGCYNLQCPGFVQTNSKISLGASFDPISTYNGEQYEVPFMIWKDSKSGNWWLRAGGELMGYWPQTLFTDLHDHATLLEFGGEVYTENLDRYTSTQMGSGHFADEGFGKASYVRNMEYVDEENHVLPISNLKILVDKPGSYDAKNGYSDNWGNYIYFGGPGNNPNRT